MQVFRFLPLHPMCWYMVVHICYWPLCVRRYGSSAESLDKDRVGEAAAKVEQTKSVQEKESAFDSWFASGHDLVNLYWLGIVNLRMCGSFTHQ